MGLPNDGDGAAIGHSGGDKLSPSFHSSGLVYNFLSSRPDGDGFGCTIFVICFAQDETD